MKKRFAIAGAVAGLLCGLGVMTFAFFQAPGRPGMLEFLLQAIIVGIFVGAGALAGVIVGWVIGLCTRKK